MVPRLLMVGFDLGACIYCSGSVGGTMPSLERFYLLCFQVVGSIVGVWGA